MLFYESDGSRARFDGAKAPGAKMQNARMVGASLKAVDLTEAYLEYRPYPRAGFRSRVRLGAFYPPMSLENRATGWETPYTITPSRDAPPSS